jgi:hypothetical protein
MFQSLKFRILKLFGVKWRSAPNCFYSNIFFLALDLRFVGDKKSGNNQLYGLAVFQIDQPLFTDS